MRSVLKYMTQWSPNRATLGAQNWLGLAAHAGAVGMALVVTAFLSHRLYGRDRSVSRVTGHGRGCWSRTRSRRRLGEHERVGGLRQADRLDADLVTGPSGTWQPLRRAIAPTRAIVGAPAWR